MLRKKLLPSGEKVSFTLTFGQQPSVLEKYMVLYIEYFSLLGSILVQL